MKKKTPISKIMTTDIVTIDVNHHLLEAHNLIKEKHIRHLPVVSEGKIVGMISKTDINKASFIAAFDEEELNNAIFDHLTIEQLMTKKIKSVQQTDLISDVAIMLSKHEFHAVPVLNGKEVVGIVTTTDLIKYLLSLM